jgi:hypothetical protein
LANPIEEQPTSIVALPYSYGSNTYAFPKGAPMMSINTNHVLTQPNVVFDALPINDLWNGLDAIFNHYNTNYCTYTCDHLIVNHDGKSNNTKSKKKNK